ncbi:MAG TPA: hypothetical protein ENI12_06835 [Nitrospirae bacterium]|nr:hypothetical protein [Nitrospirota bacterium]
MMNSSQTSTKLPALKEVAAVSIFFSLTLMLFGPLHLYYYNIFEFTYSPVELWIVFLVSALVFAFALGLGLGALRGYTFARIFCRAYALVFVAGVMIWAQGHLMVWEYGPLDGREIDWTGMWPQGLTDSAVWIVAMGLVAFKYEIVARAASRAAKVLLLVQAVSLGFLITQTPVPSCYGYTLNDSEKFEFSSEGNVIILVLDTFQSDLFEHVVSESDDYKDVFDGFVYFPDAVAAYNTTRGGVPQILTGRLYDNSIEYQDFVKSAYLSESSIARQLKGRGWNVYLPVKEYVYCSQDIASSFSLRAGTFSEGLPDIEMLIDLTLFRHSPHFLKTLFYDEIEYNRIEPYDEEAVHEDVRFLKVLEANAGVGLEQRAFKYFHLRGMHRPFRLNSELEYERMSDNIEGAHELARAVIKITERIFAKLRELGVYDNSMILVVSDHGAGTFDGAPMSNLGSMGYLSPLMMVKPFGASGPMRSSDEPVTLNDVSATVFDALEIDAETPGYSLLDSAVERPREPRTHFRYFWRLKDWDRVHFPRMFEYEVDGHSWDERSWAPTNRVLEPGRAYALSLGYSLGEKIIFAARGNALNYLTYGWSYGGSGRSVWTTAESFALRLRPEVSADTGMVFYAGVKPYLVPGKIASQRVTVMAGGMEVGRWNVDKTGTYSVRLQPGSMDSNGLLELEFRFEDAVSPFELGISEDRRRFALSFYEAVVVGE